MNPPPSSEFNDDDGGGFIYKQKEFIDQCRKMAFEKRESDFDKDLDILTKKFLEDFTITPMQFGSDLALLYSSYDRRVHWRDIQGYVNSKYIKREPCQAYLLASRNLTF